MIYPHPLECKKYYICDAELQSVLMSCNPGSKFDCNENICNIPEEVEHCPCDDYEQPEE
ncbi:MAG: chitin binding peritrophin-A domain-containing protein [Chitinophagaceae bacterium]